MPFFTASDGVRLHYELEGSGPPLLLHLGAGADSDLWRAAGYVESLARENTCILFDHRGHGRSDHPTDVQANLVDRYAEDVAELATHLGHASVAFFGWSNAVSVGLKAADLHPGLFDALILFGAIGRRVPDEALAAAVEERLGELREKGWWCILDPMIAAEKFPVPQWFLDRVVATDLEPLIAYQAGRTQWRWTLWDALPRIAAPTLYIAGELEDPQDIVAEAAAQMPNAARIRVPEREHINAFLDSEFVAPAVLDFLRVRRAAAQV